LEFVTTWPEVGASPAETLRAGGAFREFDFLGVLYLV